MSRFHDLSAQIDDAISAVETDESHPHDETQTPPEPVAPPEEPEKEDTMSDEKPAENAEAHAAGFKAANDRMKAVFASEHYAGREAYAAKLLGKDLSAEDVIDLLGDAPKASAADPEAVAAAAEEAARDEMQSHLNGRETADLGSTPPETSQRAKSDAVWDKARATTAKLKGA